MFHSAANQYDVFLPCGRVVNVKKTLEKIIPICKQIGVTRIADITGLDCIGIPVAACIRPNSKHLSVSHGKGLTWEDAQVSAIMESVESYHAENPPLPELFGSYNDLMSNYTVINPEIFPSSFFSLDKKNFRMSWVKGIDLLQNQEVYIPHALVCLDSTIPHIEHTFFDVSSNGLCAGNSVQEAIFYGLYEVIERHSLSVWKRNLDKNNTKLDLKTVSKNLYEELIQKFIIENIQLEAWNISINQPNLIPAFYCEISDFNILRGLRKFSGSAAHPRKEVALIKAITEAAQSRLSFISGARDEIFSKHYFRQESSSNEGFHVGSKDFSEIQEMYTDHIMFMLMSKLLNALRALKVDKFIVVDHTKPAFNVPVVQVFIPQLEQGGWYTC